MLNFISFSKKKLKGIYQTQEIRQITRLLLEKFAGIDSTKFYEGKDIKITDSITAELNDAVNRLAMHEPLQYVLGESEFCGLVFKVASGVLIPRPETEELVDMVIKEACTNAASGKTTHIADFCSGSGCIAVSLSKSIENSEVEGWEISEKALEISRYNAKNLSAKVKFIKADILKYNPTADLHSKYDIIISNPPYVCKKEEAGMESRVLDFEPHIALFVEDNDPLVFYRKICSLAEEMLKKGGLLYFEINSLLWQDTENLVKSFNFSEVDIFEDINGHKRFIKAKY